MTWVCRTTFENSTVVGRVEPKSRCTPLWSLLPPPPQHPTVWYTRTSREKRKRGLEESGGERGLRKISDLVKSGENKGSGGGVCVCTPHEHNSDDTKISPETKKPPPYAREKPFVTLPPKKVPSGYHVGLNEH